MAEIIENTRIGSEQASQFLPKQRFNIPKSTTQKVKSTITSLNSGLVSETNFATSAGTPYTFVLNPNNQAVFDLSQCYFNIAGTLSVPAGFNGVLDTRTIKLGNLFVSSLFQQATLSIGGSVVALNANPGIDANIQAALKFDAFDLQNMSLSDREFLLNNIDPDFLADEGYKLSFIAGDFAFAKQGDILLGQSVDGKEHPEYANLNFVYDNNTGFTLITGKVTAVKKFSLTFDETGKGTFVVYDSTIDGTFADEDTNTAFGPIDVKTLGNKDRFINQYQEVIPPYTSQNDEKIPFRCKLYLSDLFNYTVDSLDYIFNREIAITLQRASTNYIIANLTGAAANSKTTLDVYGISKFELITFSYVLTDDARKELLQFYSRPIQTLYGVQTTNLTPLYNHSSNAEQNITLPLTVTYDTKAILLAFPKCSNSLTPLSTSNAQKMYRQINMATDHNDDGYQISWYGSNSNSYNFAGLKYIRISNTSNSNIYTYDFSATAEHYKKPVMLLKSYDIGNKANNVDSTILDYREAYEQLKQLRLLFGKDPQNTISYYDYLKDYVVIPVDLTGTNLPPNTRIFVTFQFDNWDPNYNPLCYGNSAGNRQLTTNLLAVFLGSDVLEYRPDGTCVVKHVLQAAPKETEVQLK